MKTTNKNQITCPNCLIPFTIDQSGYVEIVNQIRDKQFEEELKSRIQFFENEKSAAIELAKSTILLTTSTNLAKKESEVQELTSQLKFKTLENTKDLHDAIQQANEKHQGEIRKKDEEFRMAQAEIERLKDYRLTQNVKIVGESLEKHCEDEFNKIRSFAYPLAKFGKDNDNTTGSKGDYIFRDFDNSGIEVLSIMFEMKNEQDTAGKKKKNSDFLKELDKDRNEKKCDYAVLVSMLERENEFYNTGIVDVSHEYKKMFIIRPQNFISMIGLLRNAALDKMEFKQELAIIKNREVDISEFEGRINDFKNGFSKNVLSAHSNYESAIKSIDESIKKLQNVKDFLSTSGNQLRLANDKVEDQLTIKRLTRNNPTMKKKFEDLENGVTNQIESTNQ